MLLLPDAWVWDSWYLDRSGRPQLLAFADVGPGGFGGYLIDPVPLGLTDRGTLQRVSS